MTDKRLGTGEEERDLLHVKDLCEFVDKALRSKSRADCTIVDMAIRSRSRSSEADLRVGRI